MVSQRTFFLLSFVKIEVGFIFLLSACNFEIHQHMSWDCNICRWINKQLVRLRCKTSKGSSTFSDVFFECPNTWKRNKLLTSRHGKLFSTNALECWNENRWNIEDFDARKGKKKLRSTSGPMRFSCWRINRNGRRKSREKWEFWNLFDVPFILFICFILLRHSHCGKKNPCDLLRCRAKTMRREKVLRENLLPDDDPNSL